MNIYELAKLSISTCAKVGVDHMLTGAFATNVYSIPRSTRDVDLVLDVSNVEDLYKVIDILSEEVEFPNQVVFDTITWGKRHVGTTKEKPYLKVELFELFEDPFVQSMFKRKRLFQMKQLEIETYIPTAEDIVVQKLRWARDKDLIDAKDLLFMQQPENLDMEYIRKWTEIHESTERLENILDSKND